MNAEEIQKHVGHSIGELERCFNLRNGLLASFLVGGSDWGFIVKMNAVCESFINHKICYFALNDSSTSRSVKQNEYVEYCERLKYSKKNGLIDKKQKEFLYELAELRNVLTHNIEMLDFSFSSTKLDAYLVQIKNKFFALIKDTTYGQYSKALYNYSFEKTNIEERAIIWTGAILPIARNWQCAFLPAASLSVEMHPFTFWAESLPDEKERPPGE